MTNILAAVVQAPRATSRGDCDLPIVYRDGSWFGVFYRLPLARANHLLADTNLEAMPLFGRAMATVQVWQYRDSTVGVYNELGIGIQTRRRGSSPSVIGYARNQRHQPDQEIWVVTLPVTTESAHAAGVEIWGYPKYVTPIETRFGEDAYVRLGDELEMTLPMLHGPRTPSLPIVSFTANAGRLVRTIIETDTTLQWGLGRDARIRLLGSGRTADAIRTLGLDAATPLAAFRSDRFRAVLPAGEDVGSA